MDFLRSLDGDDDNNDVMGAPSGVPSSAAAFLASLPSGMPSSLAAAASASASSSQHVPLRHRPSRFVSEFTRLEREEEEARMEELRRKREAELAEEEELRKKFALSRAAGGRAAQMILPRAPPRRPVSPPKPALPPRFAGASVEDEAASLTRLQERTRLMLASQAAERGEGDYFREHPSESLSPPRAAGAGPGTSVSLANTDGSRRPLSALAGFKTRDLFASHARRSKVSREEVVHQADTNPLSNGYRTSHTHALQAEDFPDTKRKDPGYAYGPDADPNSAAHPEVMLGLHRLRPSGDERTMESEVDAINAAHERQREKEQALKRSIAAQVEAYTQSQQRRDEETIRRQEDAYRVMFQRAEEARRAKSRPESAPMHRSSLSQSLGHSSSSASLVSRAEEVDPEEERARRDPRTAISHPDVQVLAQAEADRLAADEASKPFGSRTRPSTAGRLNVARWAEEAKRVAAGQFQERREPLSPLSPSARSGGAQLRSPSSRDTKDRVRPTSASEFMHRHRPASAALSVHGAASAAAAAPSGGSGANASLPVPAAPIEAHFRQEAWSMSARPDHEVDALTRSLPEPPAIEDEEEDEAELEAQFENHIAGAAAARMQHEARRTIRRAQAEAARDAARQKRDKAREALRLKTDVWESHRLGIVALDETAADLSLPAQKARNAALAKLGVPPARVPSHDVAFNSSVVKRKAPPPPKSRTSKKQEGEESAPQSAKSLAPGSASSARPGTAAGARPISASLKKKGAVAPKARPAAVSSTTAKVHALRGGKTNADFVRGLYDSELARTVDAIASSDANLGSEPQFNYSLYRETDASSFNAARPRPFSASAQFVNGQSTLQLDAAPGSTLEQVFSPPAGVDRKPLRPSTAALLGHSVSHPALLKSVPARAGALSSSLAHVGAHVHQSEGLATVEAVAQSMARARVSDPDNARAMTISRGTLERALIPPTTFITPQARKALPSQVGANLASNPLDEGVKKKKKKGTRKGKKGSSKKKKGSKSVAASKGPVEPEGLAFPPGTAPPSLASSSLAGDLPMIQLGDLASSAGEKSALRDVFLRYGPQLASIFDSYASRATPSSPPLLSQFAWFQLLHVVGVFQHSSTSGAPISSRLALELFLDSDDLGVESVDVDELLSRAAFLERLARVAVAKLGSVKPLPPAPLGETQPEQPKPLPPHQALESFILKFVLPNALSVSQSDIRMRMLDSRVQSVFAHHNIPLQTLFSHYAHASEGVIVYDSWLQLLADCSISSHMPWVSQALAQTCGILDPSELSVSQLFFPELLEVLARMADLSGAGGGDLSQSLQSLLQSAWGSFTAAVPSAMQTAADIAASHQAAAAASSAATATAASNNPTPRDARVKFA